MHKPHWTMTTNSAPMNAALVLLISFMLRYGAESFFRMFAASLGALTIEAAMLPASSPGTKRGGRALALDPCREKRLIFTHRKLGATQ